MMRKNTILRYVFTLWHCGGVASTVASQEKGLGFKSLWGSVVYDKGSLPSCVYVFSPMFGYSSFLPHRHACLYPLPTI